MVFTTFGAVAGPNLVNVMGNFAISIGVPSLANKDSPIIIVCNFGGQRSHKAIEILKEKGFQNVEIIEGGMCNWEKNDK